MLSLRFSFAGVALLICGVSKLLIEALFSRWPQLTQVSILRHPGLTKMKSEYEKKLEQKVKDLEAEIAGLHLRLSELERLARYNPPVQYPSYPGWAPNIGTPNYPPWYYPEVWCRT